MYVFIYGIIVINLDDKEQEIHIYFHIFAENRSV